MRVKLSIYLHVNMNLYGRLSLQIHARQAYEIVLQRDFLRNILIVKFAILGKHLHTL